MRPAEHLQENGTVGFDEARQRVAVVWPEYPGDEPDTLDLDLRAERAALLRGLLMWLTVDAKNAKSIGQRALLLGHRDNGVLLAKTYSHLLSDHKHAQAQQVSFEPAIVNRVEVA